MKFKVGDVVRCLNGASIGYFTKGKAYKVIGVRNKFPYANNLKLINDKGQSDGWKPEYFELVEEPKPTESDLKRGYWTVNNLQKELDKLVDDSISTGVKHDSGKPDMTMIPFQALEEVAKVMMFGKEKYGRDNWKAGITTTRLSAAALRHLGQWCDGIDLDKESNENHIAHAAANLLMLLWTIKNKPEMDDR